MITPQDIREKTFEKAVFGGYDMSTVDAFLEELATDLALLQKENAVLKGKMKVLVEKVEEYRGNEDALRLAVVSAQRLATTIEREAREKSAGIIAEAEAEAQRITGSAALALQQEEEKLATAKAAGIAPMEIVIMCQLFGPNRHHKRLAVFSAIHKFFELDNTRPITHRICTH